MRVTPNRLGGAANRLGGVANRLGGVANRLGGAPNPRGVAPNLSGIAATRRETLDNLIRDFHPLLPKLPSHITIKQRTP